MKLEATIQLGDAIEHRGVVLCPIFPRLTPSTDYVTLEDALPLGFRVAEVDASDAVPELAVQNPLDKHATPFTREQFEAILLGLLR